MISEDFCPFHPSYLFVFFRDSLQGCYGGRHEERQSHESLGKNNCGGCKGNYDAQMVQMFTDHALASPEEEQPQTRNHRGEDHGRINNRVQYSPQIFSGESG